jgi:hypothetical protein
MPKPDYILSFATDKDGDQVFIHADVAGLDHLIRSLTHIRQKVGAGACEHDHMMTDAWGGNELTEKVTDANARTVHHVKIYGCTPEWIQKHGLGAEPGAAPNGGPATSLGNSGGSGGPPSVS